MGWGEGGWGGDLVPICRVPLITSQKEEQALINANNMKPVVKLLINRHNNKYSYTGASDDNLLKNIELFDKLSLRSGLSNVRTVLFCSLKQRLTIHKEFSLNISFLFFRFSNRVLFIKDVIGSNEICCWSFYGHGKKIAEVCCTAIVYATDRKNTKVRVNHKVLIANLCSLIQVEFPEARIYEETLNCLLYENRTGPDQDLMQATSHRQASVDFWHCIFLSMFFLSGPLAMDTQATTRTIGTGGRERAGLAQGAGQWVEPAGAA